MRVLVVDSGLANLASIVNAVSSLGHAPVVGNSRQLFRNASHVILPGVGAFGVAMNRLERDGSGDLVSEAGKSGKHVLGICLGMQLLASEGHEYGHFEGLGLIPGTVLPINRAGHQEVPVPNVGWHEVIAGHSSNSLVEHLAGTNFYFSHSYEFVPLHLSNVTATMKIGNRELVAAVNSGSVWGVQFHPEKSGPQGLKFLSEFLV